MPATSRFPLLLLLLPAVPALSAQVVGGTLAGRVTDTSGAAVEHAHVSLRNTETGQIRELETDRAGSFSAPSLAVGLYAVEVSSAGFGSYQAPHVELTIAQTLELAIVLHASTAEEVTVSDAAPPVNVSTEQNSGLIGTQQVKELPLNGRSFDQLITLNPGTVNYTNQRSGGVGTSNSAVGSMFSVSGRRPQDNLFLLNGIEYTGASLINVTPGGTSGQLLGVDGIHEFNVVTDSYSAAYGKRNGGQISIVTTGGTNQVHGDVYEFLRNSFFDARNYFDSARIPEFQRNDFGGALGGPLRRSKLFLFGNYEGYRQNLGESLVTLVPNNASRAAAAASVRPLLNLWPAANGPEILANGSPTGIAEWIGSAPQHVREDFGTTRLDWNATPRDTAFTVYTVDDSTANSPSSNPYSYVQEALREQVFSAQEQHVTQRVVNVARFGFSRASFGFFGSVPAAQQALAPSVRPGVPSYAIVIAGSTASNGASALTGAGANVGANNTMTRNLFTLDDHAYFQLGRHSIQAGVWVQRLQSNDNLAQDQYGQASFASLSTFLAGTIKTFTYAPQVTALGWRATFVDGFIEDTVHLGPRLELRAGVRTQSSTGWSEAGGRAGVYTFTNGIINTNPVVQSNALTVNHALLLPEPRLGLAWNTFGNGRTSVTANAGLHHSLLDALDYRLDQAAPFNTVYSYAGTTVANPTGGTPQVSPSSVDSGIRTPALLAYSLRMEQQLAARTSLTVGYSGSHSYHQILNGDLNEPAFTVLADGTIYYPATTKGNPNLANTTSWWSGGSANYNSLIADLRGTLAHGLQFRTNYTWSKNLDDGSAWNTSVSANTPAFVAVPSLPHLDYGPAATDVRNALSANLTYELPFGAGQPFAVTGPLATRLVSGWSLSSIVNANSGFPFSPQLGYNPTGSGDTRNPVRPNTNPSFAGRLYTQGSTAQRVAQYFNPAAFSAPAYGTVGNVHRDSLRGPRYTGWDLSLQKTTPVTERLRAQFRAEFFNLANHTNLQTPNAIVFAAGPTQGTAANRTTTATYGSPGVISATAGTSRQVQLSVKLLF